MEYYTSCAKLKAKFIFVSGFKTRRSSTTDSSIFEVFLVLRKDFPQMVSSVTGECSNYKSCRVSKAIACFSTWFLYLSTVKLS